MDIVSIPEKFCRSCKKTKALTEFHRNKSKPNGVASECRECVKVMNASSYQRNKDKRLESCRVYRQRHATERKEYDQNYYHGNRDAIRRRSKLRYYSKTQDILTQQKARRDGNLAQFRLIERDRYWRRVDIFRARAKEYYETHKPKWQTLSSHKRAARYSARGKFSIEQLLDKFTYHGWRCYLCKVVLTPQTAHTDHRKPLSRSGSNWIANVAPACQSCNQRKYTKLESEFISHP